MYVKILKITSGRNFAKRDLILEIDLITSKTNDRKEAIAWSTTNGKGNERTFEDLNHLTIAHDDKKFSTSRTFIESDFRYFQKKTARIERVLLRRVSQIVQIRFVVRTLSFVSRRDSHDEEGEGRLGLIGVVRARLCVSF